MLPHESVSYVYFSAELPVCRWQTLIRCHKSYTLKHDHLVHQTVEFDSFKGTNYPPLFFFFFSPAFYGRRLQQNRTSHPDSPQQLHTSQVKTLCPLHFSLPAAPPNRLVINLSDTLWLLVPFEKSVTSNTARVSIRITDTVKTETQLDYETPGFNNESSRQRRSKDV